MRSSTGAHFVALDHVRALAAFLVFAWHFVHGANGWPLPFDGAPAVFPLALLDEGHTGVALFMTLSGYLFAKLLDGRRVDYRAFLWNRALRLLPLLLLVIAIVGVQRWLAGENLLRYARDMAAGVLLPTLPNGGWSLTVEFHFYLLLPALLWLRRRSPALPLLLAAAALALRTLVYLQRGEVHTLAYATLLGRVDQFALGIALHAFSARLAGRHGVAMLVAGAFCAAWWLFDAAGGYYGLPAYPSTSPLWIVLPTLEGAAYATLIAWYDASFTFRDAGWSRFVGRIGEVSYSIYLLHFFFVFELARAVDRWLMPLDNFYLACGWALACFLLMQPLGWLSYRFVEAPFLRHRKRYIRPPAGSLG